MTQSANLLDDLVRAAKKAGADAADAMLVDSAHISADTRMRKLESLERAESGDLGLRVFIGKKQAVVSATDRGTDTQRELVERAVAMARLAPEDEYCGLAAADEIAKQWPQIEMADDAMPEAEKLVEQVRRAEEAALAVAAVTNCESGGSAGTADLTFVASNGFAGHYRRSSYGFSVTAIAGDATKMVRDYEHIGSTFLADIPDTALIGLKAAERAVRRLNPRKMPTGRIPVVFERRIAGGLLGQLAGAVSGPGIARGTSFLKDKLGQVIFGPHITIIDDPFRARGLRSRPFDAEGLLPQKRKLIDKGVLTIWLLDLRSARQLKLTSTAHAVRSPGGQPGPSPSNLYMEAGPLSPAELMRDIKQGFYVTELMGMGVNGVTGDYSQAAAGFWIENGEIAFPVNEMTIAGNLKDMFLNLTPANDLEFRRGIDAPTLRIEGLTVGGV
jgi:PmbA protein